MRINLMSPQMLGTSPWMGSVWHTTGKSIWCPFGALWNQGDIQRHPERCSVWHTMGKSIWCPSGALWNQGDIQREPCIVSPPKSFSTPQAGHASRQQFLQASCGTWKSCPAVTISLCGKTILNDTLGTQSEAAVWSRAEMPETNLRNFISWACRSWNSPVSVFRVVILF